MRSNSMVMLSGAIATWLVATAAPAVADDDARGRDRDEQRHGSRQIACADVARRFLAPDTLIVSTAEVAAVASGPLAAPAYCDVRGTIRGNIKVAIWLPRDDWNGRLQVVGNGGKAGVISFDAMRAAVRAGYASASTDTGHDNTDPNQSGSKFGNDALFGKEREIDFGYRSVHLTAGMSKKMVETFYGRKAKYAYWNGCSTGGRQGLMEAQRYPDDFDGYVIGAPVYNYTGAQMGAPAFLPALYGAIPPGSPANGPFISPAKRDAIGKVVYDGLGDFKGCDIEDGVKDGQIRDPFACTFDIDKHVPTCGSPTDTAGVCVTPAERAAFKTLYTGREPFVPGMPPGTESIPDGWKTWFIPDAPNGIPQLHFVVGDSMEWLMFDPDRPGFNYFTQFDWSRDPYLMDGAARIYNATDPDLRDVLLKGKKILMYHGYQDPPANPIRSIRYRQSVIDFLANRYGNGRGASSVAAEAVTNSFLRLYMVPGMAHCGGGVGHSDVDWVTPLARWVEKGEAPDEIIGTKPGTTSTRPHCPYPQVAVYDGRGDPAVAESFSCRRPPRDRSPGR